MVINLQYEEGFIDGLVLSANKSQLKLKNYIKTFTATSGSNNIYLNWIYNASVTDLQKVVIIRTTGDYLNNILQSTNNATKVYEGNGTSFVDSSGLTNGMTYYYRMFVYSTNSSIIGRKKDEISIVASVIAVIISVDNPETINILRNRTLTMPSTVVAHYSDNHMDNVAVTWNPTIISTANLGIYNAIGTVIGYDGNCTLTVSITAITNPENPSRAKTVYTEWCNSHSNAYMNYITIYSTDLNEDVTYYVLGDSPNGKMNFALNDIGNGRFTVTTSIDGQLDIQYLRNNQDGTYTWISSSGVVATAGVPVTVNNQLI